MGPGANNVPQKFGPFKVKSKNAVASWFKCKPSSSTVGKVAALRGSEAWAYPYGVKTLHFYLLRQVIATLVMTVGVFTFVLLLGSALKEIMVLLVSGQATFGGICQAIALLIPFVLAFALPMGMLTAALLVFGRFSADQELTAVRASGISLVTLITPVLILSLFLCGLSACLNMEIAPRCRVAYNKIRYQMGMKLVSSVLPEGRYVKDFPPYMFFIQHNDGHNLRDVDVWKFITETNGQSSVQMTMHSQHGFFEVTNQILTVTLKEVQTFDRADDGTLSTGYRGSMHIPTDLSKLNPEYGKPSITDMTYQQLQSQLSELEQGLSVGCPTKKSVEELRKEKKELEDLKRDITMPLRVQIHRQVAAAFACFGFTLIGIPLGIRAHRRETNIGIAMALVLVLVYYSFIILGQSLQTRAEFAPYLIVWIPNLIFQVVGGVMLWKANKGI